MGVCSYLLVHFWVTRVAAVKSSMNAMFTNRVGDFFLTIGFFAIFYAFGTLDYGTVFALSSYINVDIITFIIILLLLGAAAKSAQIGLHVWLPMAMEGWILCNNKLIYIKSFLRSNLLIFKCINISLNIGKELFDISKKYSLNSCEYDDDHWYYAFIGDLLGDGHIRLRKNKDGRYSVRFEFTFSKDNLYYLRYLKHKVYLWSLYKYWTYTFTQSEIRRTYKSILVL